MAYQVVDLQPVEVLSRPVTFVDTPVIQLAIASDPTPAAPMGGGILNTVDISGTLSTATVIAIPLVGSIEADVQVNPGSAYAQYTLQSEALYRERIIATSPWMYWPIDEGSGTTLGDDSGNSRNGTVGGGPNWITTDSTSMGAKALNIPDATYAATNGSTMTLTTGYQGFGFVATFRTATLVNYGASFNLGAWTNFTFHCSNTGHIYIGHNASVRIAINSLVTANTWTRLVYSQSPTGKANLWINGRLVSNATLINTPSTNGTTVWLGNNTAGSSDFQHVAVWNRELTWAEQRLLAPADVIDVTPIALTGSIDADVSIPNSTLTAVTSISEAISGSMDIDVTTDPVTITANLSTEAIDIPVTMDASAPMVFTTFVSISGSMDVDVSMGNALLRRSRAAAQTNSTTPALLTLNATTGVPSTETVLSLNPIVLSFDTGATARKVGSITTPPVPESASTTDPETATGIVVRALMGVAAVMDDPTITDGKPHS